MIGFTVFWSGEKERKGECESLSSYQGRSSLFHSPPDGLNKADGLLTRKQKATKIKCQICGVKKYRWAFPRLGPRSKEHQDVCRTCLHREGKR